MSQVGSDAKCCISEDAFVPISALQHMAYCPRQCALIHVERVWLENQLTAEGRDFHRRVEGGVADRRDGVRTERSVPLRSARLGVFGIADVVEIGGDGQVFPVEYKRGRPKQHRSDEVQLCAQAVCLEEMLDQQIPRGALFYGRNRRRLEVAFDAGLRQLTLRVAAETRELIAAGVTPPPVYESGKCDPCSLKSVCRPETLEQPESVGEWLAERIAH